MTEMFKHQPTWQTAKRPGYLGKRKDEQIKRWNGSYGEGNWRIAWELQDGQTLSYEQIFYHFYVPGYVQYFLNNPNEAHMLTTTY